MPPENTTVESILADRESEEARAITFVLTAVFIVFVPYVLLLAIFYVTRKTDNRQPQTILQQHMMMLSVTCMFGSFLLAIVILALQSFRTTSNAPFVPSLGGFLFRMCVKVLLNSPLFITTIFYYLIFFCAFQRLFLIARAKTAIRLLTGRSLKIEITVSYLVSAVSTTNRLMEVYTTPWLEITILLVTMVMFLLCSFLVQHIERRMIALAHMSVLAQTVPLALLMSVFTVGDFTVMTSDQKMISLRTFRSVAAFFMSLSTPFFLIIGSWAKRKAVVSIITCQWEGDQIGRAEAYTAERTPVETSHAVSVMPTSRF